MLAKAVEPTADLRAIKPQLDPNNDRAYSARSLCHGVLVPLSAELGFSLGVNGREPLNNQPYFRMTRLGNDTPVHGGGRAAFDFMLQLVDLLQSMNSDEAKRAPTAFISVRRKHVPRYGSAITGQAALTKEALLLAIKTLVEENSEGGRRAQAVAAGLLDVVYGAGRVEAGRVNDPSRHYPGDVAIRTASGDGYERAFEVRDKPVALSDVLLFARTCAARGVGKAGVVMVAPKQVTVMLLPRSTEPELGVSVRTYHGWSMFVSECLFWAVHQSTEGATLAVATIRGRLIEVEASPAAVGRWDELTQPGPEPM